MSILELLKSELIGRDYDVRELSNKLTSIDSNIEDISWFGNWDEILESGSVVVAVDQQGDSHIQIYFDVAIAAGEDEAIEATSIKITDIQEF